MSSIIGDSPLISSRVWASVEYPVLPFFLLPTSPIFSYKTDPSCFGELMLNTSPACMYILPARLSASSPRASPNSRMESLFILKPFFSIFASTPIRGSSTLKSILLSPFSSIFALSFSSSSDMKGVAGASFAIVLLTNIDKSELIPAFPLPGLSTYSYIIMSRKMILLQSAPALLRACQSAFPS